MSQATTITPASDAALLQALPAGPLRVGVLIKQGALSKWIYQLLQRIKTCSFAAPVLIIDTHPPAIRAPMEWKHILFRLWRSWDHGFFANNGDGSIYHKAADSIADIPKIEISSAPAGHSAHVSFTTADLEKLVALDLDVLLDFAHAGAASELSVAAKYGIWFFPESNSEQQDHISSLLEPILAGAPASALSLVAARSPGNRIELLHAAQVATDPVSLTRVQDATNWRKPHWIMRTLSLLHHSGRSWEAVAQGCSLPPPASAAPGNFQMAKFIVHRYTRAAWSKARNKMRREQWVIGIRKRGSAGNRFELKDFTPLAPPADRFYADPFIVEKNGKNYLFFEELPFTANQGIISCMEMDADGHCGPTRSVLEMDYHLSYPFVFEWGGQMYMLPETRDSGKICLFRAVDFPACWKLEKVLMENVWAVDPTLFEYAGKFWLFAGGVEEHGDINSELYLFFAQSPLGPWIPHPLNPVVSDVHRARPAGKLFFHEGKLIRPGQDCSLRYGSAIALNKVVALSETEYREEPLQKLENDWLPGNLGSHTLNSSEHFDVIDGRWLVRRPFLRKT